MYTAPWRGSIEVGHAGIVARNTITSNRDLNAFELRESALAYMRGLLAPLERKNGWTVAEEAGHEGGPDRIRRPLNRIDWDADGVLADVREYVVEHLADPGGVMIVDDTRFLKRGVRSAGVQRQCSGTAGACQ
jgi:SRSO17 transposase